MTTTIAPKADLLGDQRDGVGESPVWSPRTGLWSVDITGRAIRRRRPDGSTDSWATPDLPTALALGADDMPGIVSFAGGTATWTPAAGPGRMLARPEADPLMRLNEGKCDPRGRFWVASMENNLTPDLQPRTQGAPRGRLFRTGPDGTVPMTGAEFAIPNTMAWSPDRTRFYAGDSIRNTIWVWDYDDATGDIRNRRVHAAGGPGLPDGSTIDADGCLWTARFGAGCVIRTTPSGETDLIVTLPVANPTACTFGGADWGTLFVTSARFGLEAPAPADGAVLAVAGLGTGLPEHRYRADA
jgi:sugar lactone lactonase YvrE